MEENSKFMAYTSFPIQTKVMRYRDWIECHVSHIHRVHYDIMDDIPVVICRLCKEIYIGKYVNGVIE